MRESTDGLQLRPEVAHRLGYYVYLYTDPRTEQPFYFGKGQGERALSHLSEEAESRKCARIAELRAEGKEPRVDILAHGLHDEETAFRIEAAVIDLFGLDTLTNAVHGWRSLQLGRLPLSELTMYYAAKPVEVDVPALLIRINRLYRHNMTPLELYEATRGVWKFGTRCTKAQYALPSSKASCGRCTRSSHGIRPRRHRMSRVMPPSSPPTGAASSSDTSPTRPCGTGISDAASRITSIEDSRIRSST
ncbi:MAG TPA: hypothetical protein VEO54_14720 [Thermoanaerobaculia bacterium]|nr:hypothetical protein [Thermoanaerobaculia bacterium]